MYFNSIFWEDYTHQSENHVFMWENVLKVKRIISGTDKSSNRNFFQHASLDFPI